VDVVAIGRYDIVFLAEWCDGTDRYRFLANVQVAEAADLTDLIHLGRLLFVPATEDHRAEHLDERIPFEPQ
jgi:hypothetical protein